jgi:hypothetical protein
LSSLSALPAIMLGFFLRYFINMIMFVWLNGFR